MQETVYMIIALFWFNGPDGSVQVESSQTNSAYVLEECLEMQRTWVPMAASAEPVAYGAKSQCVPVGVSQ
jgi:hypothetical protein